MDPFPNGFRWDIYDLKLSMVEEMLVSPVIAIFKAYVLPSGTHSYKGNVINYEQDVIEWATSLPWLPTELPVVIVRRRCSRNSSGHHDFNCRREVVEKALDYLNEQNPSLFNGIHLNINTLNNLPVNGSIENLIHVVEEGENGSSGVEGNVDVGP